MFLIVYYLIASALAMECKTDGDHAATCASEKCEVVGQTEVCTQCKAGGVPIDGFCRPASSPQAIAAGCTGKDGAVLTDASTACEACSGGFFLFRGGCYRAGQAPGSKICTKAEGGKCTACNAANGLFKNPADAPTLGSECILCWDTTQRDGVTGVKDCLKCTAPDSKTGAATCTACTEGHFLHTDGTCQACGAGCSECTSNTVCTHCMPGKYLKTGGSCVDGSGSTCGEKKYPDPTTRECKACPEACRVCAYDDVLQQPVCSECEGQKPLLKKKVDGTAECVDENGCPAGETHFVDKTAGTKCLPCNDAKGVANCATCSAAKVCTKCLSGFFKTSDTACDACGDNCATCSEKTANDKCLTCKTGFFLVEVAKPAGKCISCGDTNNGGIDGCAECTKEPAGSLKCTKCKPNRKSVGTEGTQVTCEEKTCEDPTACGGTAGACGAIVVGGDGSVKHYCSYCGQDNYVPIDGICKVKGSNQGSDSGCSNGACQSCAAGYFLYMGGCYKVDQPPGSLMCSKASTTAGVCETPNANSRYFAVPGATDKQQSVLRCGNPVGTTVGDSAYVGVEGCRTCTAPSEASNGAMASAKCTACGEGKALTGSGYGCVTCSVPGCTTCRADNMCEACGDGHRLEGETCVPTGPNLSTGAIAGISVAAVVVVGGLVGFLCWWFICRGKA